MGHPTYPSLYQINTRVLLGNLSRKMRRPATLSDIPDQELDRLANSGFDWLWFLGIWQTGPMGRRVSLRNPEWRREYQQLLPDFQEDDVCGSCFAITNWSVHCDFGGDQDLVCLRDRIHARGMKLMLDFVPNHTALDHPWVDQHPEFYVHGTQEKLDREPQNYIQMETPGGPTVLAFGRDPYFPGWPDTLQLNYAEPAVREAMASQLEKIAAICDGVRCDMAMLVLPEVFERTWGLRPEPFWPMAIARARSRHPGFILMAEVYWDLEWTLQQQGFNYTYDKRLYDRLLEGAARPVRDHLRADMEFQKRSARFLENHDEPRSAAVFTREKLKAAGVLTYLCPGLRFIHQGQIDGCTKRIPVHLGRGPTEPADSELCNFYEHLLACVRRPETRGGEWQLLEAVPAWDDNPTWDCFVSFSWRFEGKPCLLVVVNYAPHRSQCYLRIPWNELGGGTLRLRDLMGPEIYTRSGNEVLERGLYVDLPAWGYNVFEVSSGA